MLFVPPPPPAPPVAQEELAGSLDDDVQLDETVIVAPRADETVTTSAAKVTVVTGEELRATGERSLPRAIGRTAGVWIQESNLGGGAPIVRGLFGNQILILVDGVRLNDSTTRFGPNQSLNTLDPAIVERVEVFHGSSSVLYGSDAIGGVIAIWTRRTWPTGEGGGTEVTGSFGGRYDTATEGSRVFLDTEIATERVGVFGAVSTEDWGDLTAGDGFEQPFTGYDNVAAFGSVDVDLDEFRSLRVTGLLHRDFDVPRTFSVVPGFGQDQASFSFYEFNLQEREQILVALDDAAGGLLGDTMEARFFARRYDEERDRIRTGSDTRTFSRTEVATLGLGVDWTKALGEDHFLTFGLDLESDDVDSFSVRTDLTSGVRTSGNGDFAPNARYTSYGAFVQDEWTRWAPTYLTFGLRFSGFDFAFDDGGGGRERGDFTNVSGSVEVARDLSDSVRLNATVAQGFQAPNLEDLANDGDFAGGTEIANPDLDPAESLLVETGVEVRRSTWSTNAALFYTRIDDYIGRRLTDVGDPTQAGDETYLRSNAGELRLYGIELAASARPLGLDSPWSTELVVNWVRGRQFDDAIDPNTGRAPLDGVDARRIPPLNGRVGLGWEDQDDLFAGVDRAALTFLWAAEQDELNPDDLTDPRIDPDGTDGWTTWTLEFEGRLAEGVFWDLALVNLFDERYRVHGSGLDGAGRSLVVGLRVAY